MGYAIGWCDWCNKIIETDEKPANNFDENIICFQPHYICADCLRKVLKKKESEEG